MQTTERLVASEKIETFVSGGGEGFEDQIGPIRGHCWGRVRPFTGEWRQCRVGPFPMDHVRLDNH
jgi:hypothetical protein